MIVVVDCFPLEQAETRNTEKVNAMINSVALSGLFFLYINKIPFGIHFIAWLMVAQLLKCCQPLLSIRL